MKEFLVKNKFWAFFIALAFTSSLFLLHEYKTNIEITSVTGNTNNIIEKEAAIDDDEFESTDFYIFKNITELINDIFSIGI